MLAIRLISETFLILKLAEPPVTVYITVLKSTWARLYRLPETAALSDRSLCFGV